jgi:hypothetical protein
MRSGPSRHDWARRRGLVVGRSGAEPVTEDYTGQAAWPFVANTSKRVVLDLSGQAFVDLATQAHATFARR